MNIKIYLEKRRGEIGESIRAVRRKHKWSQEQVAEFLGCSRAKVNRVENGSAEFTVGELELLAEQFGVSIIQFLGLSLAVVSGSGEATRLSSVIVSA